MKKLPIFSLFAAMCAVLLSGGQARAQVQVPPTPRPVSPEIARYAADYFAKVGGNATLFYGRSQAPMQNAMESMYLRDRDGDEVDEYGVARFPRPVSTEASYAVGDVFYDGVLYPGVTMRLDLHRDQMVVTQPGAPAVLGVVLDPERFGWADLRGYRVIRLPAPVAGTDLPEGYYLQLYDGRHRVLKKEMFDLDFNQRNFTIRTVRYYVEKDGIFHGVKNSKGSVLRLLSDRRGELNRYIRGRGLRVRRDMERVLVEIVEEYERLNETAR